MATATRIHPPARLSRGHGLCAHAGTHLAWAVLLLGLSAAAPAAPGGTAVGAPAASALPRTAAASGPSTAPGARNSRPLVGCLIGPERVADIGTPVIGVVSQVKVDRGDAVAKGDALVLLNSGVETAGVDAARSRASIDAEVRAAEASALLATQRHTRTTQLVSEGFVTAQAAEQTRAERDVAMQKLAQARGQHTVQRRELGQVQAQLAQRTLRSPFRGVVIERFVNPGERVDDKPLLRLAQLDPLRVELVLPANRWGSVAAGDRVGVTPELPGAVALSARVTHIDKVIDAGSNTFRVRLALPNPDDKLPAGARCKVDAAFVAGAAAPVPVPVPALVPADAAPGRAVPLPSGVSALLPAAALAADPRLAVPALRRTAAATVSTDAPRADAPPPKRHKLKKKRGQAGERAASAAKRTAKRTAELAPQRAAKRAASDSPTGSGSKTKHKKKKRPARVEA